MTTLIFLAITFLLIFLGLGISIAVQGGNIIKELFTAWQRGKMEEWVIDFFGLEEQKNVK
ncbi:hypothetical protein FEZ51_01925 [Pediococcus stilesii]|uniref:Uncharacterized protein n=1 Tax=Pediococcus stilesii TaxID=331679 RepID=A0A5R9BZC6_9LACO|nr:hypothetical protein [Pediococcus stilesii]TLQ05441.1 hypothetical protein FEZ51_01925 [Pediococcus stilesii]